MDSALLVKTLTSKQYVNIVLCKMWDILAEIQKLAAIFKHFHFKTIYD